MAMTRQAIESAIESLCERDDEIKAARECLDMSDQKSLNEVFQLLILLDELKIKMETDVVHFSFRKKDGTVRQAYGTRASEVILRHEGEKEGQKRKSQNSGIFPYFDIERQAWRCFKFENLVDINRGYTL